jgi:hypothetical protein
MERCTQIQIYAIPNRDNCGTFISLPYILAPGDILIGIAAYIIAQNGHRPEIKIFSLEGTEERYHILFQMS